MAWIVLIFFSAVVFGLLLELSLLALTYVPALSANPLFYVSPSRYPVRLADQETATATALTWQYPHLVVEGARYKMKQASLYRGKIPKAVLSIGTVIEFIGR